MDDAAGQAFTGVHHKLGGFAEGVGKVSRTESLVVGLCGHPDIGDIIRKG